MTEFDPAALGPSTVRVGTAERERAAAALGEHFAAGRLEVAEYDERVGLAYSAKTAGDLARLFTDLPRPQPAAPPRAAPPPSRKTWPMLPALVVAVIVLGVVIVAVTKMPFFIFPVLFLLFLRSHRGSGRRGYRTRGYHRL
ncbi:MAG: DUF1707 domain-containing protein [Nocardia sp.]|nr:DUF1707 domain-containing protein [Nocardia sp.]